MFAISSTLHSTQYCLACKFYATLILLKTITKFDCLVCCLSCFVFAFQHFSGPTPGQPTDNVGYWSLFSSIAVNKTWSRGPESGCLSPVRGFLGPVLWRRVRPVIGIIGAWSPRPGDLAPTLGYCHSLRGGASLARPDGFMMECWWIISELSWSFLITRRPSQDVSPLSPADSAFPPPLCWWVGEDFIAWERSE